jgi:hypothetical protein
MGRHEFGLSCRNAQTGNLGRKTVPRRIYFTIPPAKATLAAQGSAVSADSKNQQSMNNGPVTQLA